MNEKNPHWGSTLDDFLKEEGIHHSDILDIVHEMARDMFKAGAIDENTMRKIDALCSSAAGDVVDPVGLPVFTPPDKRADETNI